MLVTKGPCIKRQCDFAVQLLHKFKLEQIPTFLHNLATDLNHFLNRLNCILTHLHNSSFHTMEQKWVYSRRQQNVGSLTSSNGWSQTTIHSVSNPSNSSWFHSSFYNDKHSQFEWKADSPRNLLLPAEITAWRHPQDLWMLFWAVVSSQQLMLDPEHFSLMQ